MTTDYEAVEAAVVDFAARFTQHVVAALAFAAFMRLWCGTVGFTELALDVAIQAKVDGTPIPGRQLGAFRIEKRREDY